MKDIGAWIAEIVATGNTAEHWTRIDQLLETDERCEILLRLHAGMRQLSHRPEYWQVRSCMEHFETAISLHRPERSAVLIELLAAETDDRHRNVLLDMASQEIPWPLLRDRLIGAFPHADLAVLELAACHALRGTDVGEDLVIAAVRERLGDRGDERSPAWFDPSLLSWASNIGAVHYHIRGSVGEGGGISPRDEGMIASNSRRADGDPFGDLRFSARIQNGSAIMLESSRDDAWPSQVAGFPPLADEASAPLRIMTIQPREAFALMATIAIHGGAYDHGTGPLAGMHATWRDWRRLLGLPPGSACRDVAEQLSHCLCVSYPTDLPWFKQVAWDGLIGFKHPPSGRTALIAWTDED